MDPILGGALIGGGAGLLKSIFGDGPAEQRQKRLAGATIRFSPWTGMQAQPIKYADPFGSILQGGTSGALMGGMIKAAGLLGKGVQGAGQLETGASSMMPTRALASGVAAAPANPAVWDYIAQQYSPATGVVG